MRASVRNKVLFTGFVVSLLSALYFYYTLPDQEIPLWYNVNLCPVLNASLPMSTWVGVQLETIESCPVKAVGTRQEWMITKTGFIPDAAYSPVLFRKDGADVTISYSVWLNNEVVFQTSGLHLPSVPIPSAEGGDGSAPPPDEVADGDLETGRRILKSGSSYGGSRYYRRRWGSSSRYPTYPPVQTAYGWVGPSAVVVGTFVQVHHRGPPLPGGAVDCINPAGCQYELRNTLTRDEFVHDKVSLPQSVLSDASVLRLVVDAIEVSHPKPPVSAEAPPSFLSGFFGGAPTPPQAIDPEVFITFATRDPQDEQWQSIYASMVACILCLIVFFGYFVKDILRERKTKTYRNESHFPWKSDHGIGASNPSRTSHDGDYKKLTDFIGTNSNANIKEICCTSNDLRSIAGVPDNTERLIVWNNDLTSLDTLRDSNSLVALDAANNDIVTVSMPRLPKLVWLNLSNNCIVDVDGELKDNTPKLKFLNVASNDITELDLRKVSNIQEIDAHNNDIHKIDLPRSVTWLDLSSNDLEDVRWIRDLSSLSYVNLSNNRLFDVGQLAPLAQFKHLIHLDVRNNNFSASQKRELADAFMRQDKADTLFI